MRCNISSLQKVQLHILDLSQPRKVIEFANSFVESEQGVDVLVNNAGVMVNQRELTEEGLEKNFSTNTLGKANVALKSYVRVFRGTCIRVLISQERIY